MMYLYYCLSNLLLPLQLIFYLFRVAIHKDTLHSIKYRFGWQKTLIDKPVIWLHSASIGEAKVAVTLINSLQSQWPQYQFIITTTTLSAYNMLTKQELNFTKVLFPPIENYWLIQRFLNQWQLQLVIFIESELWPALLSLTSRRAPILLVNARLSDRSYQRWQNFRSFFVSITSNFQQIVAQSPQDLIKFQQLGVKNCQHLGNIKLANAKLAVDLQQLNILQNKLSQKRLFVASSTHIDDEIVLVPAIVKLKKLIDDFYPVIILRHPDRRLELVKLLNQHNLSYCLRSKGDLELDKDVYIVDNFGEVGLFYQLSFVSFIGGSFANGGHNPLEAAHFQSIIIFGPDMSNFTHIAKQLLINQAAIQIHDSAELVEKIEYLFNAKNQATAKQYQQKALDFVADQSILKSYIELINHYLT